MQATSKATPRKRASPKTKATSKRAAKADPVEDAIRDAIVAELNRQGRTLYWLAKAVDVPANRIYGAMRRNFGVRTASRMLHVLGLRLVPKG